MKFVRFINLISTKQRFILHATVAHENVVRESVGTEMSVNHNSYVVNMRNLLKNDQSHVTYFSLYDTFDDEIHH